MAQGSGSLHEDPDVLGPEVIDQHRAIVSIMEELEAADGLDCAAASSSRSSVRIAATSSGWEKYGSPEARF